MSSERFIERVLQHITEPRPSSYTFTHWRHGDRPTDEGCGLLPVTGADPAKVLDSVFDVDHYTGTVPHVLECRAIADERFRPPDKVRFYQCIKIPLVGEIHHELVLERLEPVRGFQLAVWSLLEVETAALRSKPRVRSQYSDGVWLAAEGVIGFALSSAPRRDDVGLLKWKALTTGANALAGTVIRENIEAIARWAVRR